MKRNETTQATQTATVTEPTIASFAAVGPGWRVAITIDRSYRCALRVYVVQREPDRASRHYVASAIGALIAPDWTIDPFNPSERILPTSENTPGQVQAVAAVLARCDDLAVACNVARQADGDEPSEPDDGDEPTGEPEQADGDEPTGAQSAGYRWADETSEQAQAYRRRRAGQADGDEQAREQAGPVRVEQAPTGELRRLSRGLWPADPGPDGSKLN